MTDLTSKYMINGPNNIVRLENGEKILYIFGDIQLNVGTEQECAINDDYESIDIDKLLLKFIKKEKNIQYDLFIEEDKLDFIHMDNVTFRNIYLNKIRILINSKIEFDKNKIITNKKYPNFRVHYSDIRESLLYLENLYKYYFTPTIYKYTLRALKNEIEYHQLILLDLKNLLIYLESNDNKYINKIKNVYNDKNIQKKINNIFKEIIITNLNEIIKNTSDIIVYISTNIDKMINIDIYLKNIDKISYEIYLKIKNNKETILWLGVVLTDLYLIRRFLDKDYIKKSILYTGLAHMTNILFILVKYFNFKLTNIFYSNSSFNLDNIKNLPIKNFEYINSAFNIFTHYNENYEITQCSNLFNFPPNFT